MSGIEIIGLVLGAIPLFISAAEHYRDGLGFVKRAIRKHDFVAQYRLDLIEQQTLLRLYLKAIVSRTTLTPSVQAMLVDDLQGDAWQRPDVTKALSQELAEAYQPFCTLLTKICISLAKQIRSDESVDPATNDEDLVKRLEELCMSLPATNDASKDEKTRVYDRIKFSWKQPKRLALLAELKEHNVSLEKLGTAANRAKPYERKQQTRRVHTTFKLRGGTERLYQAMCKACSCQSLRQRDVGLGLAVRHALVDGDASDLSFEVIIFDAQNNACTVSVKMVQSSDVTAEEVPGKKRVRIGLPPNSKTSPSATLSMKKLHDICKDSEQAQQNRCCLRLVLDEKDDLYSTNEAKPSRRTTKNTVSSLCDIMSDLQVYDCKRWFHREKAILAVILAYSLLQVHESSWWQSLWDSESISFLLDGANSIDVSSPEQRIRLRQPFTRAVLAQGASSPCPPPVVRRNAHLHALGIVLLELYLNRSIKAGVAACDGGADFRGIAQDLLDEHSDDINMTTEYLRAVRFCLSPHPNRYSGSFSFQDEGFREIFYDEVISMLEDHLSSRFEISDSMWQVDDE